MNPAKGGLSVNGFRLRHVGLGFLWAWIYCTWFSPAVFGGASGLTVNNDGTWIVSVLFVSLSLLISPFLFKRDLASIPWVLYAAPLATSVGAIAMSHQAMFAFSVPVLSFVGAAVTGICSGWLWIMWGEFFCSVDLEVTYIALPLTVAVPLCCILLTLGIRGAIAGVLVCLLPLPSGVCLFLCFRDREIICPVDTSPYPSSTTCIRFLKQGIASLFIYACISFCWSLISYEAVGGVDCGDCSCLSGWWNCSHCHGLSLHYVLGKARCFWHVSLARPRHVLCLCFPFLRFAEGMRCCLLSHNRCSVWFRHSRVDLFYGKCPERNLPR